MSKTIKITIDIDDKKQISKDVVLKDLNLDDEADLKDLFMEYYNKNQNYFDNINKNENTVPSGLYKNSLKAIRLATDYTDEEIKEIPDSARIEIFTILMNETMSKKK